ncbi:MAG: hypothetical protein ACP5E4_00165 [Candidatus Aenigmatarchaeota archaeon]
MRGVAEEMLGFMIIAIVLTFVGLLLLSGSATNEVKAYKARQNTNLDEDTNSLILSVFDTKLPNFDKTYAEILVDANLQGYNKTQVYYGKGMGSIDVEELITPVFDGYFGEGRWALDVVTWKGNITYGEPKGKDYVYEYPVPCPHEGYNEDTSLLIMRIG